jgi:hypothetical protein
MSAIGRYLYAVIDADPPLQAETAGIDGGEIYTIDEGGLAAVVSDLPNRKVRPERRKLAAHYDVLKRLLPERPLLPMAFGLIAEDSDAVRSILALNQESFREQLRRFEGKIEMGLRLVLDVPNAFEYFVAVDAELRAGRDDLFADGRQPSQDEKMALGRMFEESLGRMRATALERVTAALAATGAEIKELSPRSEKDLVHAALLLSAEDRDRLETAIAVLAESLGAEYTLELNGPWPPHNFIEIDVRI